MNNRKIKALDKTIDSLCTVPFEKIEGTSKILIAGHEFQNGTQNGVHKYWYCKYRRTQPKTCCATCRQAIDTREPSLVEITRKHSESSADQNICHYISGKIEKMEIRA